MQDEMKICSTCLLEKAGEEFYRKGGRLQSKCKECQHAYCRLYFAEARAICS